MVGWVGAWRRGGRTHEQGVVESPLHTDPGGKSHSYVGGQRLWSLVASNPAR